MTFFIKMLEEYYRTNFQESFSKDILINLLLTFKLNEIFWLVNSLFWLSAGICRCTSWTQFSACSNPCGSGTKRRRCRNCPNRTQIRPCTGTDCGKHYILTLVAKQGGIYNIHVETRKGVFNVLK